MPDLILMKKSSEASGSGSSEASGSGSGEASSSGSAAVHVVVEDEETLDIIEIKTQCSTGRVEEYPHAFAQIFAELHFLATANVLKDLKGENVSNRVRCHGLLINKSGQMALFTLNVVVGGIDTCWLEFEYANLSRPLAP